MKKAMCFLLAILTAVSLFSAASAAGYTLPEKMQRQLQVGSGLKGSFAVHANTDPELCPFVASVQSAEFEIRGIRSGDDLHYYIFQPGEGEALNSLTEYCRIGGTGYIRSDFLPEAVYRLPGLETVLRFVLDTEGENPSILPEMIRMIINKEWNEEETFDTEALEKQIELWINSFSSDTSVSSAEGAFPRLTQIFRIPVKAMFNAVNALVKTVSENIPAMELLKSVLTEEQIAIYLNPNLGYFYTEAMESLNLDGEIVFSRTMSTLGELINNELSLPLDAAKTGWSSITLGNGLERKSVQISGPKGLLYLEIPLEFDPAAETWEEETFRLICISTEDSIPCNIALQINASKSHEKHEDTDEQRNHETVRYTVRAEKDLTALPEGYSPDLIPDISPAEGTLELHYDSKLQLSSPTTLEISCAIRQGQYDFTLAGKVKTSSPWTYTPFEITSAMDTDSWSKEDFEHLKTAWISKANEKLVRTPEEIKSSEPAEIPEQQKADPAEMPGQTETEAGESPDETAGETAAYPEDETEESDEDVEIITEESDEDVEIISEESDENEIP